MINAIRVHQTGGPEVLQYEQIEIGEPGAGEAKVRHEAIGLNFIDVYFRTGLYKAAQMPFTPGNEGAGIVVAVGSGVENLKVGDRVAYAATPGSYAEERILPADRLVKVPDSIELKTAAAMMLKGMTAQYLLRQTFVVKPGHTILFHAAAGGVGLIAGQWAKHLGATVIGTAGSEEKIALAKAHGYDHVINYRTENFVERVKELTGGEGVNVVYDSVGRDTYMGSLDVLKPLGMFACFGQSSGVIPPFDLNLLAQKGSLFATRPTLFNYVAKRAELEKTANELFDVVASGAVKIEINQTYALKDVRKAHEDLEARKTTGASILLP
ncbi:MULTISPECIES: quinone oxidoreductase family protein [Brucella]|jgi:NADPH2:quinone reductase|uniref:quinone oxidoreductase family protein n=1 Tax=Brucella TaxID=234 RepID=UPI000CFB82DF|nr:MULTISPECIES: quinone oxidoreductase [Brucella]MQP41117.1 NADPH:quinone reductase [Ochrobactrum sp. MYb237]PQZ40480.1 quinone oxidoreductase [Brucella pseudogrignonensis]PRA40026.1 quinone oxidoreductase [Brucella pseudogrignonensis]PRA67557.1 quinone oxidoreductase [Brucella pseudogrignonensis]